MLSATSLRWLNIYRVKSHQTNGKWHIRSRTISHVREHNEAKSEENIAYLKLRKSTFYLILPLTELLLQLVALCICRVQISEGGARLFPVLVPHPRPLVQFTPQLLIHARETKFCRCPNLAG